VIEYAKLKQNRRTFLALSGLTHKEFRELLPAFERAYAQAQPAEKTVDGHMRQRRRGGGRPSVLATPEQKLLFILVYLKTYPLQVVMGELFGMSQAAANQWIHRLLPIIREALRALAVMPERTGTAFARSERTRGEPKDYIIDGTERRRQRPKDPKKQALHYSGKKKAHSDKNVLIVNTRSQRVSYLSPTGAGKTHDKKAAELEQIDYPRQTLLRKDTGFQGYEPRAVRTQQPKKSREAKS
jgi:DDE superfamily endonuclease